MDRFVLQILDPHYLDFRTDLLARWEAERPRAGTSKDALKGATGPTVAAR